MNSQLKTRYCPLLGILERMRPADVVPSHYHRGMPLIRIVSSASTVGTSATADALLRELSALLARELGKPEAYVMTCLEPRAAMTFAGTSDAACYVEVKNVGTFSPEITSRVSAAITTKVAAGLSVAHDRIYIEFADARPHMWGYDGGTFA
jgi:phenylpyruvate tautomerase